ncbi:unnamed protein product, partial [Symbiodinium pilosum]
TVFVSHQWLGIDHPDRLGFQFQKFQQAVRGLLEGKLLLSSDLASYFIGTRRSGLSRRELARLQNAYIWLDWFSIPQSWG